MNNKGQLLLISVVFGLIMFFLVYALFLAEWSNEWTDKMVSDNDLTGIEAFLMDNFQLWVFIGLIIGVLSYIYLGRG
jgi:hypothetical protein